MGDFNNNILGLALMLPDTPDGCQIIKPFEIPTSETSSELFLKENIKINNDNIIDVIDFD